MKTVKLMGILVLAGMIVLPTIAAEKKAPAKKAAPAAKAPAAKAAPQVDIWVGLPDVVAEIDGVKVGKNEVIQLFMSQLPDGKVPPFFTAELVKQDAPRLVKAVVSSKLFAKEMAKSGFKATAEQARKFLEEEIKKAPKQQLDMMVQQLAMQGKTLEQHIRSMADNPVVQNQIARAMFAKETFLKGIKVTEQEAEKYYKANSAMFKTPADAPNTIRASHILITTDANGKAEEIAAAKKKIEEILAEIKNDPSKFPNHKVK